jgi:hypothetical protein
MSEITCHCGRLHKSVAFFPLRCRCGAVHSGDGESVKTKSPHVRQSEQRRLRKCGHRGEIIGTADCDCQSKPPVYQCGVHDLCMPRMSQTASLAILNDGTRATVSHSCQTCKDWQSGEQPPIQYAPITTRNLIYHVYPKGGWLDAVSEIAGHLDAFNGQRIVAVAFDSLCGLKDDFAEIERLLKPTHTLLLPNDRDLRETITFEPLLRAVLNDSPSEATFYGHTKANTTDGNVEAATKWRQVMTANLLGRWQDAMGHLQRYTFVGTHKMIWPADQPSPFPTRMKPAHPWMHSGTFYWFRHDRVSSLNPFDKIARDRYGVEAWPAQLIPHEEAYSMWQPWEEHERAWPQRNPYDPGLYDTDYSR